MIFFVSFICFIALLASMFISGSVVLALQPYYVFQYSYMQTVGIISFLIIVTMMLVRLCKKIVFGPLGWYDGFKKNRIEKAYKAAFKGYMLNLGGNLDGLSDFHSNAKYLKNDPFYWLIAYSLNDDVITKQACNELTNMGYGNFLETYNKVNKFLDEKMYENALMALESEDGVSIKTLWYWDAMFVSCLQLNKLSQAELLLKQIEKHGGFIDDYILALAKTKAAAGIDKLENLRIAYSIDDTIDITIDYIKELIGNQKISKAEKVIKDHWSKHPVIEIGMLINDIYADLVPVERFTVISEFVEKNVSHYASKYLLARGALDAGLYLIARENLMELAQEHPILAFPLLAKLEKFEKNDLKSSNVWLEKAVKACLKGTVLS